MHESYKAIQELVYKLAEMVLEIPLIGPHNSYSCSNLPRRIITFTRDPLEKAYAKGKEISWLSSFHSKMFQGNVFGAPHVEDDSHST